MPSAWYRMYWGLQKEGMSKKEAYRETNKYFKKKKKR